MGKLTHVDEHGQVHMVDVGGKASTERRAIARGTVTASAAALAQIVDGTAAKGDVLATARIAGIMAAKRTPELIPLCHTVALSSVQIEIKVDLPQSQVVIKAIAKTRDRTGVEMEALTAVSVAALTIYDMLKAVDKGMRIGSIELVEKRGGKSGIYRRPVRVVAKTPPLDPQPVQSTPQETRTRPVLNSIPPRPDGEALSRARGMQKLALDDPELIRYLAQKPIAHAYMLGDLDEPYAEHGTWYGLSDPDGRLNSVLLLYQGLSMPAVLTAGEPLNVEALLAGTYTQLPRRFYANVKLPHQRALEVFYDFRDHLTMSRMGLHKPDYTPVGSTDGVFVLTHKDTGAIMKLYQHYPDNFFDPTLLGTGLYCGIREDGELISVAGVHLLSEQHNIAAIGNIVTHTDHRARGLATRCIRWLLDALFERVDHVALNVAHDNAPAVTCYSKFGFKEYHRFLEGWASLR